MSQEKSTYSVEVEASDQKNGNKLLCMFYCCKSLYIMDPMPPFVETSVDLRRHVHQPPGNANCDGKYSRQKLKQGIDIGHSQRLIIIVCSRDGLSSRMLLLCSLLAILRSIVLKSVAATQPACMAKRNHVKMAGSIVWHSLQSCRS